MQRSLGFRAFLILRFGMYCMPLFVVVTPFRVHRTVGGDDDERCRSHGTGRMPTRQAWLTVCFPLLACPFAMRCIHPNTRITARHCPGCRCFHIPGVGDMHPKPGTCIYLLERLHHVSRNDQTKIIPTGYNFLLISRSEPSKGHFQ